MVQAYFTYIGVFFSDDCFREKILQGPRKIGIAFISVFLSDLTVSATRFLNLLV